jgi:hypothetical protein
VPIGDVLGNCLRALFAFEDPLVDQSANGTSARSNALSTVVDVAHIRALARPRVVNCAFERGPIEQQTRTAMDVAVLLPHAGPGPAAVEPAVLAALVGVVREAEHSHPITGGLQLRVDLLDRVICVGRVAMPGDARQDVLVLDGIAHEPVWAQAQRAARQDVPEHVRGLGVVRQQPFRLGERVIRDLHCVGRLGHGSTYG